MMESLSPEIYFKENNFKPSNTFSPITPFEVHVTGHGQKLLVAL